jgi:hypothetical protein
VPVVLDGEEDVIAPGEGVGLTGCHFK